MIGLRDIRRNIGKLGRLLGKIDDLISMLCQCQCYVNVNVNVKIIIKYMLLSILYGFI